MESSDLVYKFTTDTLAPQLQCFLYEFFDICIEFLCVYFPVLLCLSVSVKWLAVKTASKMTYCVSGGALNSTHLLTLMFDITYSHYDQSA